MVEANELKFGVCVKFKHSCPNQIYSLLIDKSPKFAIMKVFACIVKNQQRLERDNRWLADIFLWREKLLFTDSCLQIDPREWIMNSHWIRANLLIIYILLSWIYSYLCHLYRDFQLLLLAVPSHLMKVGDNDNDFLWFCDMWFSIIPPIYFRTKSRENVEFQNLIRF